MKQKDIILIIVVVFVSGVVSIVASNLLISAPKNRQQEVEIIEPIVGDFQTPDTKYFNANSINPTQLIEIEKGRGTQPFNNDNQ